MMSFEGLQLYRPGIPLCAEPRNMTAPRLCAEHEKCPRFVAMFYYLNFELSQWYMQASN
jgi:hypothetical protein